MITNSQIVFSMMMYFDVNLTKYYSDFIFETNGKNYSSYYSPITLNIRLRKSNEKMQKKLNSFSDVVDIVTNVRYLTSNKETALRLIKVFFENNLEESIIEEGINLSANDLEEEVDFIIYSLNEDVLNNKQKDELISIFISKLFKGYVGNNINFIEKMSVFSKNKKALELFEVFVNSAINELSQSPLLLKEFLMKVDELRLPINENIKKELNEVIKKNESYESTIAHTLIFKFNNKNLDLMKNRYTLKREEVVEKLFSLMTNIVKYFGEIDLQKTKTNNNDDYMVSFIYMSDKPINKKQIDMVFNKLIVNYNDKEYDLDADIKEEIKSIILEKSIDEELQSINKEQNKRKI